MKKAFALSMVLLLLFVVACAATSGDTGKDKGVSMIISPLQTHLGGSVTVSGATAPNPRTRNRTVTIRFMTPRGETIARTAELDKEMRYELRLAPVQAVGEWQVTVNGPVTQLGEAVGTFVVVAPGAFVTASARSLGQGCVDAAGFSAEARHMTTAFTELPEKETALEKMADVEENFHKLGTALASAATALDTINSLTGDLEAFPEVSQAIAENGIELTAPVERVESLRRQLDRTLGEINKAGDWCRRFHFQKQGWNFCIDIVQAAFTPGNTLYKFAKGKLADALKSAAHKAADSAVMQLTGLSAEQIAQARQAVATAQKANEIIKTSLDPDGDFSELTREGVFSGAKWLVDWVYSKAGRNCRMYQAEFSGRLWIDYYAKNMVYMVATYPISGELKVFFDKRQSGSERVDLKGQVQGRFGWRTGLFFPERTCMDVPGMIGAGFCVPRPPFIDFLDFVILVKGEGKPHGIELEFSETLSDVERLPYMYGSVLWSPYQVVPAVDFPKMDVPGARWFFTRVTKTAGESKAFYIPLTVDGDTVKIKHEFTRVMDYIREREFKAKLNWKIEGKEDGI